MAKKTKDKPKRTRRVLPALKAVLKRLYQRGVVGLILVCLALITFFGLVRLNRGGFLTEWWYRLLLQGFGWGSYVIVAVVATVGALLLIDKIPAPSKIPWHIVGGLEIVFIALLGLSHLLLAGSAPWDTASAGHGGGYVGAVFSTILAELLGPVPAGIVLGMVLGWGLVTASGLGFEACADRVGERAQCVWRVVWARLRTWFAARPRASAPLSPGARSSPEDEPAAAPPPAERSRPPPPPTQRASSPPLAPQGSAPGAGPRRGIARGARIALPPLDLLDPPPDTAIDEAENRHRAQVIEETLNQFGVPAKVVEINPGPMVTQFGVEPGYVTRRGHDGSETERKIRVAKIASLNNDLALALAAAPIRIEAPVPGRSIVGIEVPNSQVSLVSLRAIMASAQFRKGRSRARGAAQGSRLKLPLGEGTAGAPIVADLARMPHLLIAGATGSGKSVCINAIATSLLFQNAPYTLRLVMIDPKRVELARYQGIPHLYGHPESDVERIVGMLRWLVSEMQGRYKKLAEVSARDIDDYNRHWRVGSHEYMPRIVVLIDELADLMLFAPDEVERSICRLAQMARATGIHLVIATQRPSVDVVTGLIKANFPARIGFAVSSGTDSRVILDAVGAETLLSKGDMLFMPPDASKLVRAQGSFVSDAEMQRVVRYWREWAGAHGWEAGPAPWEGMLHAAPKPEADDLLQQAIEIVRERRVASASMLQRRMRIGYPRASRLIDEMEALGVIGPARSGGRPREVLDIGQRPVPPSAGSG